MSRMLATIVASWPAHFGPVYFCHKDTDNIASAYT
ncbi:hypothetical protein LR69_00328 [Geobacillus sp. BCO2]|nr:hypothetical protein LR69_00328 [Geobacillus sp. BCO2]